jgi:hypothetical protein
MMKKRILGSLALLLGVTAAAPAMARTDISPPWGNSPVIAYIGSYRVPTSPPAPVIIIQIIQWKRISDGLCQAQQIGGSGGLSDDYMILGTTGGDRLQIRGGTTGTTFCGKTISALAYNGHFIDLAGRGGGDILSSWGGDTYLWGEDGNDGLYSQNPNALEDGGPGDDAIIFAGSSGPGAQLLGGDGSDCLDDINRTSSVFNCGGGTDYGRIGHIPVGAISCERTVSTCGTILP